MFPSLNKQISSRLASDKIYIFFTKLGLYFVIFLFIIFLMSLSYGNSFAYSLLFLSFSILSISALYTNFTLENVKIVFAGPKVLEKSKYLFFNLQNNSHLYKMDLYLKLNKNSESQKCSLSPKGGSTVPISVGPLKAGVYFIKRITLFTEFPFKIMFSWKYKKMNSEIFVFPDPKDHLFNTNPYRHMEDDSGSQMSEALFGYEFFSYKHYQEGENTKFINWKYYSKNGELLTKTFESGNNLILIISEDDLLGLNSEKRLEQISFWSDLAISGGIPFKYDLNEIKTALGQGASFYEEQMIQILRASGNIKELGI